MAIIFGLCMISPQHIFCALAALDGIGKLWTLVSYKTQPLYTPDYYIPHFMGNIWCSSFIPIWCSVVIWHMFTLMNINSVGDIYKFSGLAAWWRLVVPLPFSLTTTCSLLTLLPLTTSKWGHLGTAYTSFKGWTQSLSCVGNFKCGKLMIVTTLLFFLAKVLPL